MANILVLGGGFGGVVAAEELAKKLGHEHQITLVSRSDKFLFYPGLVRLVFEMCEVEDISYNLRDAMLDRRIRFIEAEVARIDPHERSVTLARGEVSGELTYDYLIFALGRRLATELVPGFFEHAHHLLTAEAALKFGEAVRGFEGRRAVIGYCPEARLPIPAYETAFALARSLTELGAPEERARITLVSPEPAGQFGGLEVAGELRKALANHGIEFLPDFPINQISAGFVRTMNGHQLKYDLLMLIPPFRGAGASLGTGITDEAGYIRVDRRMRVAGVEGMYAVGDCVNFEGPKMGHMAVRQGAVAAANLIAEIEGREASEEYEHEVKMVIDAGGKDSIYLHENLWTNEKPSIAHCRFWSWAKRVHEKYWERQHS